MFAFGLNLFQMWYTESDVDNWPFLCLPDVSSRRRSKTPTSKELDAF